MSVPEFTFTDELLSGDPDCWGVVIPELIDNRIDLFNTYVRLLSLPSYFGKNLDALDECLRDLSWIDPQMKVIVQHADLPLMNNPEQCQAYLAMLRDSVRAWQIKEQDRLSVTFLPELEEYIEQLLTADFSDEAE